MVQAMMTRGQFAIELARKLGLPLEGRSQFSDTVGTVYDLAVAALKKAGITTGTSSATFSPFEVIKREDAATMIGRAYDIRKNGASVFSDVASNHYASQFLNGLQEARIFNGVGGGLFGAGGGFSYQAWDLVSGRINDWQKTKNTIAKPTSSPGATTAPTPDDPTAELDAFKWAEQYLKDQFDLPGMGTFVQDLISRFGANLDAATIDLELRGTPEFDARFGAVMKGRADAGYPAVSATDILAYENAARSLMRSSGLPPGFYDSPDDFVNMMINDVSPSQLRERIALGFERVSNAPIEIRQAYADFYGVQGDEALAAFLLDPAVATPLLEKQLQTAEVAGTGRKFGFTVSEQRAAELAGVGVDQKLAFTGFSRLSALSGLFSETIGDNVDLTAEGVGIDATLLGQGDAQNELTRRVEERKAAARGGGGAALTNKGVIGAGTAQ